MFPIARNRVGVHTNCGHRRARVPCDMRRVRLANVVRELPRHGHALSRRTVAESQRWRLIEAVTEVTARLGYGSASVADVVAAAGVSRKTFYEHFGDKEDCFLSAYEVLSRRLLDLLVADGRDHPPGTARRRSQLEAFLAAMARDPTSARVFMVDVLGAGASALARRQRVNEAFGRAVLGDDVDPIRRRAIVGGVNTVVAGTLLRSSQRSSLMSLAEPLASFVEQAL